MSCGFESRLAYKTQGVIVTAKKHPLLSNEKWLFSQPEVGIKAHYLAVDRETGKKENLSLQAASTCREGVVSKIRETFRTRLTNQTLARQTDQVGWKEKRPRWAVTKDCDFAGQTDAKKAAELSIVWYAHWMSQPAAYNPGFSIEEFIKVCDIVLGPVAVLLGPGRPTGSWWKTDPEKALVGDGGKLKRAYWKGSDNWFLAHPATVGIATGLYRQCFHLCAAGVAEEIIESVSDDEIEEVMSTNSQKLALLLIKKTRPWIEVPVPEGRGGYQVNFAFPIGFWRRLIRLQRAVRQVGYEESLGQNFHEGWSTTSGTSTWTGIYTFWGTVDEPTSHHEHLMKAGAPRRRTRVKPSKKAT